MSAVPLLDFALRLQRRNFVLAASGRWPLCGITVIFGASGCGKTSLLRSLAGLEPTAAGHIRFAGEDWLGPGRHRLPTHRRGIGLVLQQAALFRHLNVRGNILYGMRRTPAARRRLDLEEVAAACGVTPYLQHAVTELSGGQRQRVALARALAAGPRLLLLDEPLANLDATAKAELLPCLRQLQRRWQVPIIYVTHQLDELATIADRVVCMQAGEVQPPAPAAALLADPSAPLARRDDAQVSITARITGHDANTAILHLQFAGGSLRTLATAPPPGPVVRLGIHARDVSLARAKPDATSILNILPATVVAIEDLGAGRSLVRLDCAGTPLLARITSYSATALQLSPGLPVYAQVKAIALVGVVADGDGYDEGNADKNPDLDD